MKETGPMGTDWEDLKKQLFTPEEIAEAEARAALVGELIKADLEAEKPGATFYSIDEAFELAETDDEL